MDGSAFGEKFRNLLSLPLRRGRKFGIRTKCYGEYLDDSGNERPETITSTMRFVIFIIIWMTKSGIRWALHVARTRNEKFIQTLVGTAELEETT